MLAHLAAHRLHQAHFLGREVLVDFQPDVLEGADVVEGAVRVVVATRR